MADETPDLTNLGDEELASPEAVAALRAQLAELTALIAADRKRFGERVLALLQRELDEAPDDQTRARVQAEIDQKRAELAG